VTTRSSSSGVVTPAFTFSNPSSPSEIMPELIAESLNCASDPFCAIMRRSLSVTGMIS
jgi:hypothetical protein